MKIGINAKYLLEPFTNYGKYTYNLLSKFDSMNLEDEFYLFVPEEPKNIKFNSRNFHLIIIPEKKSILGDDFSKFWWENFLVPVACEKLKLDIYHSLYQVGSVFKQKFPVVVTFHDTTKWKLPSYHKKFISKIILNLTKVGLKNSYKIISTSINTKLDIAALLDVSYKKIIVLPNGITKNFNPVLSITERDMIKTRYNIHRSFILYVGGFDKRKNLKKAIESFSILVNEKGFNDYDFIIAGSISINNKDSLYYEPSMLSSYASELGLKDTIKFVGAVSESDLANLYKMASVFLYPTLFEGFGMPVAESFACATPVVTSYTGSMMEISKNGAVFVDPFSSNSIADGISEILKNKNIASRLSISGFEMSRIYDWDRVATETINVYKNTIAEWKDVENLKNKKNIQIKK